MSVSNGSSSSFREKPEDLSSMTSAYDKELEEQRVRSPSFSDQSFNVDDVTGVAFDDPNLDPDDMGEYEEDSPYPEVRCAVSNTDDPEMPVGTIRAWLMGLIWAVLVPLVNQFFFFRYPSVSISGLIALLTSFPLGRLWEISMPKWRIFGVELNPGPFNMKEHVLITIMASIGCLPAYATDVVAVQRMFYNQKWGFSYQWFIVMSTQLIGFSIGGLVRRFLVTPPAMIWPANLVDCALFNTLHSQRYAGMGNQAGISRERFFLFAFIVSTCWYFIPAYIFTALSWFAWVTWLAPNNRIVNQLFGYQHGLGMSILTFDWAQISYIGSPLVCPWWVEVNVVSGFVLFYWLLTPILYYSRTFFAEYMPISGRSPYDRFGGFYNVSKILDPSTATFNATGYHGYSPLFLPMTLALSYGVGFAAIASTLTHSFLYYRRYIAQQMRKSLQEQPDIHARLMSVYPEVPQWWYGIVFLITFVFGVVAIEVWPTQLPVWAFVLALVFAMTYTVPVGMIEAITNKQIGLNIIAEMIIGFAVPGKPLAMMLFKTWGYITMTQALAFASNLKLGHYMKIPPRTMFWAQVISTIIGGTVQLGVQAWLFENVKDICTPGQPQGFICAATTSFNTATTIWGVVGPRLLFAKGSVYFPLIFGFVIGAIAPIISWWWTRRHPQSWMRFLNFPVFFSGTSYLPPATAMNYVTWATVGFIFQYVVRRRRFTWWAKYNYVLSAALDSGVAVGAIIIFFALQFPRQNTIGVHSIKKWWGNTIWMKTTDYRGQGLIDLQPGESFGPSQW